MASKEPLEDAMERGREDDGSDERDTMQEEETEDAALQSQQVMAMHLKDAIGDPKTLYHDVRKDSSVEAVCGGNEGGNRGDNPEDA